MTEQLTLFKLEKFTNYDSSQEPPDPDEYPTREAYESAWASWERRYPDLVPLVKGMSDIPPAPEHNKQVTTATISAPVIPRVREQVTSDTQKVAPEHDTHWIEKYWVERANNKYWYWRYMFMEGRKIQRVHIGAVGSPKAQAKKSAVEIAIEDGRFSPQEIKKMIRTWQ